MTADIFKKIGVEEISDNPFKLIGKDWMLVTAGKPGNLNAMTASWGGVGVLWNKPVCFIFIRPHRYTFEFLERENGFTLSFFDEKYRSELAFFGKYSGRDVNKLEKTNLTPIQTDLGMGFEEARMILDCRKIYFQDINPENFVDTGITEHYPNKDYHRMYVGEIASVYVRK